MTIAERILAVLRETGARKRNVLDGLAGGDRRVVDRLLRAGKVRYRGRTKAALVEVVHA